MNIETAVLWQSWLGFVAVSVLLLATLIVWGLAAFSAIPSRVMSAIEATPVLGFAWCVFWSRRKGKGFSRGLATELFLSRFKVLREHEPEIADQFLLKTLFGANYVYSIGEVTVDEVVEAAVKGLPGVQFKEGKI